MNATSQRQGIQLDGGTLLQAGKPERSESLHILDARITGSGSVPGMETLDVSGGYVLPGLIDCHDHTAFKRALWEQGPAAGQLMGALMQSDAAVMEQEFATNAARVLRSGVTTVRDFGVDHGAALRASVADSPSTPRIIPGAQPLGIPGGHLNHRARAVTTAEGVEVAIREHAQGPARWIKLFASGGIADYPRSSIRVELSTDLMRIAVDTAHELGLRVAAHALPVEAVLRALHAGVDSIEHGVFLTDEAVSLMAESGVWYVPTLSGYARRIEALRTSGQHEAANEFEREVLVPHADSVRLAASSGVKIGLGTDITASVVDEAAVLMDVAGLDFEDAFRACTTGAAELLGLRDGSGTLEVGARADILVLGSDPRRDIRAFQDVRFVIRAGQMLTPGTAD